MLKFGNKEFRNLQEQVYKNMSDILFILQEEGVLNEFGIKVIGQEESVANMPTVADYKESNPNWSYGDTYAIGTKSPYTLYILTRANGTHPNDYWFNIGSFPVAGPTGPQGPQGEIGPQGPTGNPGTDGLSAGFGTIIATATTLPAGSEATASVVASGTNTEKNFSFTFGIPEGEKGKDGASKWGEIGGSLENQTDLMTALQGKQNTLVSGTNIKTINNESILGSGNISLVASVNWNDIQDKPAFATVATSGSYNDLSNKPIIPTKTSDLTNDSSFITISALQPYALTADLSAVALSGNYNDLSNKPSIPDISNLVTLNTEQTIAAHKTFANPVDFHNNVALKINNKFIIGDENSPAIRISSSGIEFTNSEGGMNWLYTYADDFGAPGFNKLGVYRLLSENFEVDRIKPLYPKLDPSGYGLRVPETNGWTADKVIATVDEIPTAVSELNNDSGFITSAYHDATKQDVISDLATIRSGAALGATAVQPSAIEDMATKTWVGQQGFLTSVSWSEVTNKPTFATVATTGSYNDLKNKPTNLVTTDTAQIITGAKTFQGDFEVRAPSIVFAITGSPGGAVYIDGASLYVDENLYLRGSIHSNVGDTYGLIVPDTSAFTASKTIATTDQIPTVPTNVSEFTNDAGYITGITSGMVTTALGFTPLQSVTPTSETWTFTLDDDSTVTKTVVTAVTSA